MGLNSQYSQCVLPFLFSLGAAQTSPERIRIATSPRDFSTLCIRLSQPFSSKVNFLFESGILSGVLAEYPYLKTSKMICVYLYSKEIYIYLADTHSYYIPKEEYKDVFLQILEQAA